MSNNAATTPTFRSSSSTHFLAGLTTGILSAFLLQPADLLKTRLQQSQPPPSSSTSTSSAPTLLPTLRAILAQPHPILTLWRGTLPSVLRTGLGSALYFSTLNALRTRLALTTSKTSPLSHPTNTTTTISSSSSTLPPLPLALNTLTGALARAWAGFLMMPVTVLKVRYESNLYAYRSLRAAAAELWRREGVRGFWAGWGATAVRDAPYAGVFVGCYEGCKKLAARGLYPAVVEEEEEKKKEGEGVLEEDSAAAAGRKGNGGGGGGRWRNVGVNFGSGMVAAVVASGVTNPFDAVKTRLQLWPGRYGNLVKGVRVGRKAVSSAGVWCGYEEFVRWGGRGEGKGVR